MADSVFNLDHTTQSRIRDIVSNLSLERKAAQAMNMTLGWFDDKLDNRQLEIIEAYQPGTGMGGGGSWKKTRSMMEQIQPLLDIPMVVSADFESGVNFTDGTPFPSALGRAAVADLDEAVELTRIAGATAASQGIAAGVHWSLAPVVDINANFRNPITNVRSYGDDLERINALAAAYIAGMQSHGMAATIKHFPGDGYSDLDQHKLTTVNPLSRDEWFKQSGAAFRHAIQAGVYAVMPGHIACPALSVLRNERGRPVPATFNRELIDVLRNDLGFTGVIVSDALGMGGALEHCSERSEAVIRALCAGIDIPLMISDIPGTVADIVQAVESGVLTEDRLDESVGRVLAFKATLGMLDKTGYAVPTEAESSALYEPRLNEDIALKAAEKSITLTHDIEGILPLDDSKIRNVLVNIENEEQFWGEDGIKLFGNELPTLTIAEDMRARGLEVDVVQDPGEGATYKVYRNYDAIFYLFNNGPQPSRNSISPCRQALRDIDWRVINSDIPVIFVALRSPYLKFYMPGIPNLICTYANSDRQQAALVKAVFGDIPFEGKLPVKLPSPE